MAVIKCKMCGGDLEIKEGLTVAECEYCGSRQTIPTADNEKKLTLFGRAGRLLRGCEFDKAAGVFESIVADFPEEAEAYWGLVLCKYGIEYVDDPATGKKIPTCHRSSFDSVLDDENFEQACENADAVARSVYRAEARAIEELRKGIIQVSSREEPYDVFICYKETDDKGERTLDSVIAQDIYTALTEKGYRVFFSRISLEDKLGVEYEPYIFAALNSAKLMLAVGTDYEHFNAVWVKNEWSRFLALIASGQKKTLIPCYKNIDAYDMPREFAKLSAQDMGKVGAMQDLLRGVEKILGGRKEEKQAEPVTVSQPVSGGPNVRAMIDRGNMALEDGKWQEAAEYFNRALDMDARCADAYLGQLLAKNQCADDKAFVEKRLAQYPPVTDGDRIAACPEDTARINAAAQKYAVQAFLSVDVIRGKFRFDRCYYSTLSQCREQLKAEETYISRENDFVRAERFASGPSEERVKKLKRELLSTLESRISEAERRDNEAIDRVKEKYAAFLDEAEEQVKKRNEEALAEQAECERKYQEACALQAAAVTQEEFENAEKAFSPLIFSFSPLTFYKDANMRKTVCSEKAKGLARYAQACAAQKNVSTIEEFDKLADIFTMLARDGCGDDSASRAAACKSEADKLRAQKEQDDFRLYDVPYQKAMAKFQALADLKLSDKVLAQYGELAKEFDRFESYKQSKEYASLCKRICAEHNEIMQRKANNKILRIEGDWDIGHTLVFLLMMLFAALCGYSIWNIIDIGANLFEDTHQFLVLSVLPFVCAAISFVIFKLLFIRPKAERKANKKIIIEKQEQLEQKRKSM